MLAHSLPFSPELEGGFFEQLPAMAAVFTLRGYGEPYISKTANLRRRLLRLLGPPSAHSKRLNLRDRVREIEFTLTGSDFESQVLLYRLLRQSFPQTYAARLRLRSAPLVKLHLENAYPRASVTSKLGKFTQTVTTRWTRARNRTETCITAPSLPAPLQKNLPATRSIFLRCAAAWRIFIPTPAFPDVSTPR